MKTIYLIYFLFHLSFNFNSVFAQVDSVEIKRYDSSLGNFTLDYYDLLNHNEFGTPFLFRREYFTKDSVLYEWHEMNRINETSISRYFDKEGNLSELNTCIKDDYCIRFYYYPDGQLKSIDQIIKTGEELWESGRDGWQFEYSPDGMVVRMCLYDKGELIECTGHDH